MLGLAGIFATSFVIGFSGALVPGPVLSVTIHEAGRRGARAGPLIVLGHGIAEVAITVALIAGLSSLLSSWDVRKFIAVGGGVVLIWMGLTMLIKIRMRVQELESGEVTGKRGTLTPVLLGMTTTVSNPYWFGWWGTIGATLVVTASDLGWKGIAAFVTGHILSDLVWYTIVSYLVSVGLRYTRRLWYRVVFGICASLLVALGILFIRYGIVG